MSKRKRFILSSLLLSLGFIGIQVIPDQFKILGIVILGVMSLGFFTVSLWEGISVSSTLLTLLLPVLYTLGVGFFWFLLPASLFARIPIVFLYGIGIYALLLTMNIYTVSAIRTIALLRAARGVGFVLTLLTIFLIFDTILSLKWWVYLTVPAVLLTSFPLFLQGFWSFELEQKVSAKVYSISIVSSVIMAETAAVIFFWPVSVVVGSLFLTVSAYMLLGLGQAEVESRLFTQTVKEYSFVGIAVLIAMFIATHWD
jgi:hypothetical protein